MHNAGGETGFPLTVQTEQLPSADIGFFIHIVAADNINQILDDLRRVFSIG